MTVYGVDEAWQRLSPAEAKAAGKSFVIGYVSENTTGKNITKAEIASYLAAGVAVLLVYEYATNAVEGGAAKGARDAGIAIAQARALGYPAGCALGFAIDEDESAHPGNVDAYSRAYTAACHAASYRSMEYGGYAAVKRCADLGLTDLHWQTYAWSHGLWDPRCAIRQVRNGAVYAGKDVDDDQAMVADFGAWDPNGGSMSSINTDALIAAWRAGMSTASDGLPVEPVKWEIRHEQFEAATTSTLAGLSAKVDALAAAVAAGGGSPDVAAFNTHLDQVIATQHAQIAQLAAQVAAFQAKEAAAAKAEADALAAS